VRPGAVVSTPFDHVSILATLATRFGIASLGPRMDAAADLSSCIDPDRASVMAPAAALPPTIEIPRSVIRSAPFRTTSQPELERLARAGGVPAHHVDPRGAEERLQAWLRHAQALEAVRIIG
jgi:phospholipase C